jgi:hypothetical protein
MGHHFVPQRYLRNFEDVAHPGYIWVHDRHGATPQLAKIDKVAQSRNFYSQTTEVILAESVERPANPIIAKLTSSQSITLSERFQLAYYIAVMLKRIPAHRRHVQAMVPEALADVVNSVRKQLEEFATDAQADPDILKRRGVELDKIEQKFQTHLPQEVLDQIREPWPSTQMVEFLFRMTWHVLTSVGPTFFVTSDNPAFYFTGFGLARKESELCFPLSTHCALHGSWQATTSGLEFMNCRPAMAKEINRRIVSAAERLVFYHQSADWILRLFQKQLTLNKIEWNKAYFAG